MSKSSAKQSDFFPGSSGTSPTTISNTYYEVHLLDIPQEVSMKDNISIMDSFKSPYPERNFHNNPSSIPNSPLVGRNINLNSGWFDNQSVGDTGRVDDEFTLIYANDKTKGTTLRRLFGPSQPNEGNQWINNDNISIQSNNLPQNNTGRNNSISLNARLPINVHIDESFGKNENQDDGENDEDDDLDPNDKCQKKKFNKGLKLLSVIVRDIVVEKQSTTYKEVADIILRDTIKFENLNIHSQLEIAKEEQNIKRRVYDALNVLISAGILIKEGKKVRKNEVNKKIKINMKRMEINTLKSKIVS